MEVIGELIKDRIANTLWDTLEALQEAIALDLLSLLLQHGPSGEAL